MNYSKRFFVSVLLSASLALIVCLSLVYSTGVTHAATASAEPQKFGAVPATTPIIGATRLVFTSDRDGNPEIYSKNGDNSPQINLTNNPARDACPVLSPDGTKIAFTSDRSGRSNIYVMNSDGANVQAVTHLGNESVDLRVYDPAWSPDGTKLIYVSSFMGEVSSLVVVNADGSGSSRALGAGTEVADPAWSPDGTRIAFVGRESFFNPEDSVRFSLFVINADGSGKTRVATEALPFNSFAYPPEASGPSWSPDGTRLAFVSNRDGNAEIYTVSATGGEVKRLTNNPAADTLPTWIAGGNDGIAFTSTRDGGRDVYVMSSDGALIFRITGNAGNNFDADWQRAVPPAPSPALPSRLAFLRANPGNSDDTDIYTSNPDGTNELNVTNSTQKEKSPAWSPDGKLIAYVRRPDRQLFVMDADGTSARPLAFVSDVSDKPSWSPDSRRIAFIGGSDLAYTLSVVNIDGTGQDFLVPGNSTYFEVAWSPDGNRLAYVLDRFSGFSNPSIGVINLDGTSGRTISVGENRDTNPAWSPDGSKLAFTSTRDGGNAEIYLMNPDGTNQTRLTNHAAADKSPTWSPDGRTLVFTSDRDGNFELYRMNASDGSNQQRITTNAAHDIAPDWNQRARSTVQWRNSAFRIRENGQGGDPLVVTRLGDLAHAATVDYAMTDGCRDASGAPLICPGLASDRSDYVKTTGTLRFAPGEASQTLSATIIDDAIVEGDETFNLVLTNATGAERGEQHTATVVITDNDASSSSHNPIDEARFFVRLHYLDFLGREPEQNGLDAWVNVWTRCPNIFNDPACDRVTISSSFFRSTEFYIKGYFIYRFYRAGLGRRPTYAEFVRDLARLSAQTSAELDARKDDFNLAWMGRADFRTVAETFRSEQYLDRLLQNVGVTLTGAVTRETLLADMNAGRLTRAAVLRAIVEHPDVERTEYNGAFVTMQYFGYLKRDPDTGGYNNWLNYLNANPQDYRTMVKGFVTSIEYRARFGTP